MKYFGTDGIRDRALTGNMTPEMALKAGRAFGLWLTGQCANTAPISVVLGQDTRVSGDLFASAVAAGIATAGVQVLLCKIFPTPGIAYITKALGFSGGVVISASHNPYYDNGIKFFKAQGLKLSDADEQAVEQLMDSGDAMSFAPAREPGIINLFPNPDKIYGDFLNSLFQENAFNGISIVLDCANGAASYLAQNLFKNLGADIITLNDMPNGININDNCGSEHPEGLIAMVKKVKADVGFAFDGDADRLTAVDAQGEVLSGDKLLTVLAKLMQAKGQLHNDLVVSTVMSNLGLKQALAVMGIKHNSCAVGDRNVLTEMQAHGAMLGGEDSGHIICLDVHSTGDGILSAMRILEAMCYFRQPLQELARDMKVFPQILVNVEVKNKPPLEALPQICNAIKKAEDALGDKGRVLVRYSGTQSMCRVMVEGEDRAQVEALCNEIAGVVADQLNNYYVA